MARQPGLAMFLVFLVAQTLVGAFLQVLNVPFGLAFSGVFLLATPAVLWCLAANFHPAQFLRLDRFPARLVGVGALVGLANFLLAGALQMAGRRLLDPELVRRFDPSSVFRDLSQVEGLLLAVAVTLFAPVCEEVAFRGYLQTVFEHRWRRPAAVLVGALLFSLVHLEPAGFAARVELGALFGLLVVWSGSLWPAIAAHAANNLVAAALILRAQRLAPAPGAETGHALPWAAASAALCLALVALFRTLSSREPLPRRVPEPIHPGEGHAFDPARAGNAARRVALLAAASFAVFLAVDWRGASASLTDATLPYGELRGRIPDEGAREALVARVREARRRARSGFVPLARYRALRRALWGPEPRSTPLTPEVIDAAFSDFERHP